MLIYFIYIEYEARKLGDFMEPIKNLKGYAKQIAKALDEKDDKKNRIESNEWNNVFNVEAKKGKRIERYITLENAEKSIMAYLIRCEKDRSKRLDLAEQWLNDLNEKADEAVKQENFVELRQQKQKTHFDFEPVQDAKWQERQSDSEYLFAEMKKEDAELPVAETQKNEPVAKTESPKVDSVPNLAEKLKIGTNLLSAIKPKADFEPRDTEKQKAVSKSNQTLKQEKDSVSLASEQPKTDSVALVSPFTNDVPEKVKDFNINESLFSLNPAEEAQEEVHYEEVSEMTKMSSAKHSEEPINADILEWALDNVLKDYMQKHHKKRSALIGSAKDFIAASEEHNVNTFVLMGIQMHESACGTSPMSLTKNNTGGLLKPSNGKYVGITYSTVSKSINGSAKVLGRNVNKYGLETINSVGMRGDYCCENPQGRSIWVNGSTLYANNVREEYNRLLAQNSKSKEEDMIYAAMP